MDSLHLSIAITPLAIYLCWLGVVNLSGRPRVVGGFRDAALVAFAVSGFMIAGPLELFLPETAAFRFGPAIWLLLFALYLLVVSLIILSLRPRIVIYNLSQEELRPVLVSALQEIDPQARWAGDSVDLPTAEVHLHLERLPSMRNVQLVSSGPQQSFSSWHELEKELRSALAKTKTVRNSHGVSFLIVATLLLVFVVMAVLTDRAAMAQTLQEMLRM